MAASNYWGVPPISNMFMVNIVKLLRFVKAIDFRGLIFRHSGRFFRFRYYGHSHTYTNTKLDMSGFDASVDRSFGNPTWHSESTMFSRQSIYRWWIFGSARFDYWRVTTYPECDI